MDAETAAKAAPKNYRPLPDYDALVARWLGNYDKSNYDRGLSASVLRNTHALVERPFGPDAVFPQVLEVGAGTLAHLPFVRHRFERYIASDFDQSVLDAVKDAPRPKGVELLKLDGSSLPFDDCSVTAVLRPRP